MPSFALNATHRFSKPELSSEDLSILKNRFSIEAYPDIRYVVIFIKLEDKDHQYDS